MIKETYEYCERCKRNCLHAKKDTSISDEEYRNVEKETYECTEYESTEI